MILMDKLTKLSQMSRHAIFYFRLNTDIFISGFVTLWTLGGTENVIGLLFLQILFNWDQSQVRFNQSFSESIKADEDIHPGFSQYIHRSLICDKRQLRSNCRWKTFNEYGFVNLVMMWWCNLRNLCKEIFMFVFPWKSTILIFKSTINDEFTWYKHNGNL